MLEHAERGCLLQLYKDDDPPFTFAETTAFWLGLLQVAKALMIAHNDIPKRPGASWYVVDSSPIRTQITD